MQIGVTFSQNAGDYNLELAEYQVSLAQTHGIFRSSLLGVRILSHFEGGKVVFVSRVPQQLTFKIHNLFSCNCHSCATGFYGDLFTQWGIPITKQTQQVHTYTMHSRPHLKSDNRWLIVGIYNVTFSFLLPHSGQSLLAHFTISVFVHPSPKFSLM